MPAHTRTTVTSVTITSGGDDPGVDLHVEVGITRSGGGRRTFTPYVGDVPPDVHDALAAWLGGARR